MLMQFLREAGPFIFLQAALALVVLLLALVNSVRLARRRGARAAELGRGIDAILFWGGMTALFGFFAQWVGLHRAANVVFIHDAVNPKLVILGIGESLNTTVFGMFTLVVAAFLWFALRVAQRWRA